MAQVTTAKGIWRKGRTDASGGVSPNDKGVHHMSLGYKGSGKTKEGKIKGEWGHRTTKTEYKHRLHPLARHGGGGNTSAIPFGGGEPKLPPTTLHPLEGQGGGKSI